MGGGPNFGPHPGPPATTLQNTHRKLLEDFSPTYADILRHVTVQDRLCITSSPRANPGFEGSSLTELMPLGHDVLVGRDAFNLEIEMKYK